MMFQHLFSPLKLGRVELKNRISFQPHLTRTSPRTRSRPSATCTTGASARRVAPATHHTEEMSVHPTDRARTKLIEAFRPR